MKRIFKTAALLIFSWVMILPTDAQAGSGKCSSGKRPQPKAGSCVGIPNCKHDQAKEDTASINAGIRKVAQCITSGKIGNKSFRMEMVSGYRCRQGSPGCNRKGYPFNGGAACSQHLFGNAIDFRLTGANLETAQSAALQCGAVNAVRYPCKRNNFVHMDTGRKRQWSTCGRPASEVSKSRVKNVFAKMETRRATKGIWGSLGDSSGKKRRGFPKSER
jgi:hypothetical protein